MAAKKKASDKPKIVKEEVVEKVFSDERELLSEEFEQRDITWAVGVRCVCGHELDLFQWNEPVERVCKKCSRKYDVRLKVFEVGLLDQRS